MVYIDYPIGNDDTIHTTGLRTTILFVHMLFRNEFVFFINIINEITKILVDLKPK